VYLDTAILVKLFIRERDSHFYARLTEGALVLTSTIAFTEVWSALLAKERNDTVTLNERDGAWQRFSRRIDEGSIILVAITDLILKRANRILAQVHPHVPLRALDALHLASCDQMQEWPLCTNDQRMRGAAERLRFPLTPLPD
jgi:predicted nucleic acid-binding protein